MCACGVILMCLCVVLVMYGVTVHGLCLCFVCLSGCFV